MKITTAITVFIAAVASATPGGNDPHPDGSFGSRYTDHQCKQLHSLPNRHFSMFDCISTETVGSISITEEYMICHIYSDRHCNGIDLPGNNAPNGNKCINTSEGPWKHAGSFKCWMGHT